MGFEEKEVAGYSLGISCFYHDSAAVLVKDGVILHAIQEERLSRLRHDAHFPILSIKEILKLEKINWNDITTLIYYEKPFVTFERLVETYLFYAPRGISSFLKSMPLWLKEKLFVRRTLTKHLKQAFGTEHMPELRFSSHHLSHAASAFFPSPFEQAAVLCVDGVGEWATTTGWIGDKNTLKPLWEIHFPHSLGLLYSALTGYLGFKVNSGEYKVMGLAPYGNPIYFDLMKTELIHLHDDGSFSLNMDYFAFPHGLKMFTSKLEVLLGHKARKPESNLTQFHMDVAASLQKLLEEALIRLVRRLHEQTKLKKLVLAGGVALNCVANSRLLELGLFEEIWVQPAAGDAGGALGAALAYEHLALKRPRVIQMPDSQKGTFLGSEYSDPEIEAFLNSSQIPFTRMAGQELFEGVSEYLAQGKVIGWFQSKMEFGPRALGHRSILGDARMPDMQKKMNLKIKFRESFRPFAPAVLEEDFKEIFEFKQVSPYMLFTGKVKKHLHSSGSHDEGEAFGIERLNQVRSTYPSITHIDYSARLQTVNENENPVFHQLIKCFKHRTGHGLIVNTSFNVRGEPIVCGPEDAYKCFRRTEMDVLVLNNFIITKDNLPAFTETDWQKEYQLD